MKFFLIVFIIFLQPNLYSKSVVKFDNKRLHLPKGWSYAFSKLDFSNKRVGIIGNGKVRGYIDKKIINLKVKKNIFSHLCNLNHTDLKKFVSKKIKMKTSTKFPNFCEFQSQNFQQLLFISKSEFCKSCYTLNFINMKSLGSVNFIPVNFKGFKF